MNYTIHYDKNVLREIKRMEQKGAYRIWLAIDTLSNEPRPIYGMKLKGKENEYRIRVGDYRVLYAINNIDRKIIITHIKHRKDAYR